MIKNKVFLLNEYKEIDTFIENHEVIKKHGFVKNYKPYLKIYYKDSKNGK